MKILLSNWKFPPDPSNFLQWVVFSDSDFQTELQQFHFICADLSAHNQLCDPVAGSAERGMFIGETMLHDNGAFQITGAPTTPQIVAFLLRMTPLYTRPFRNCAIGQYLSIF